MKMNPLDAFLKKCEISKGPTLIVGSKIHEGTGKDDRRRRYEDVIGIDMDAGDGVDLVMNLEEEIPDDMIVDHIECTSVLEHSRRPWLLAANLEKLLIRGGTILIMVPWVWRIHNYPGDYWRMTPQAIRVLFPSVEWERTRYIVEGNLSDEVPRAFVNGVRFFARSELIMFGRKCSSTS